MKITLTQFRPNTAEAVWTDCFAQAIAELHKAGGGVLTVPAGEYSTGPIELCSNMELHLEPGAVIRFLNDPAAFPLQECQYEGRISHRPKPCLSAFNAENVALTGSGVLDGCGAPWWAAQRARTLVNGRPYLLHFENVTHLRVCGVQLRNSPAWTVHPLNCVDVLIEDVSICNPYNSPNTDGINPESCRDVRILNCRVDVGDDCITLKSGTEETPNPAPCENIVIANCLLVHGHGGIVIGSEMSGGVRNVTVTNCVFTGTDRGLRVKNAPPPRWLCGEPAPFQPCDGARVLPVCVQHVLQLRHRRKRPLGVGKNTVPGGWRHPRVPQHPGERRDRDWGHSIGRLFLWPGRKPHRRPEPDRLPH